MRRHRRFLLPAALASFIGAVGLFFFAASGLGAQTGTPAGVSGSGGPAAVASTLPGTPGSTAPTAGTTPSTLPPSSKATPAAPTTTTPTSPASAASRSSAGIASSGVSAAQVTGHALADPTLKLPRSLIPVGRVLFVDNCSSCHGTDAAGSSRAPNLLGLGAATVDFWVSTGRMPLANPTQQATVKPPRFNTQQTHAIAAYVSSLAPGGPGIPIVHTEGANQANGGSLFALNCAGCHTITGVGDALSASAFAPSLYQAQPTQIYEAIRIGPGQMPRFSNLQLSPAEVNDLVSYVSYLHHASDPGGAGLGHVGPVTEGFIGLLIGLGSVMLVAFWIGDRA